MPSESAAALALAVLSYYAGRGRTRFEQFTAEEQILIRRALAVCSEERLYIGPGPWPETEKPAPPNPWAEPRTEMLEKVAVAHVLERETRARAVRAMHDHLLQLQQELDKLAPLDPRD